MNTIVIGLGNPILSDDGVGIKVAREVQKRLPQPNAQGITITETSVGGLRLMEMMMGYDRVILVDALTMDASHLGKLHRLTLADLQAMNSKQHTASAHDTTLPTALAMGQQMGFPLPKEIVVFGIGVAEAGDFGKGLSAAVSTAVPKAVTAVLAELI